MEEKVMKDCKVLALCSQKGGVGKTTSCVNLAVGLAKAGKKVLVIDNDPQGSMTASLGYHNPDELPITLATILTKIVEDELFENTLGILHHQEGIDLIPANIELSGMEVSLVNIMSRELVLKQYIERMREEYDYILIDCMEISGKVFTEKKEAGAALLAVCKDMKAVDAAMDIGNYQGFNMRIQFDSWSKEFILSVKHESVSKVHLGADALGNITRINNLLESYPEKLAEAEQRLETVQEQLTNAKEEVGKPFTKEEELNQKLERLSELNALLNMDEREDTEAEQSESKEKEERPARGSIHEKLQIYKEKSQRESENGREDRKRDFGLE